MQPENVRGPRGVQLDEVWAAADAVLAMGQRPTIERVRQHMGRGSPNTVGPMLDGWYGSLSNRLDVSAETGLPAPVVRAAKALWGRAMQLADERATVELTKAREELDARAKALQQAQDNLAEETQRFADRTEAYGVAMQAKEAQIVELGRLVQELQQQLTSNQEVLASARSERVQLRLAADADRRRQEAKEVEHQAERSRLEERAQAQERRLNAEVDRSRQESKRLALQLESDNRKSAKSLSDSQDRARELEAQIGALQGDKVSLAKDLQAARDEMKSLQARFDERSNDMFAVLNELRDRLPPSSTGAAAQPTAKNRKSKKLEPPGDS